MADLDRTIAYRPWRGGAEARCRLRAFFDPRVAVVTELADNPGMSVTNAAEAVAAAVEQVLDVRFYGSSWRLVEHYDRASYLGLREQATFDLVTFRGYGRDGLLCGPCWQPLPDALAWLRAELGGGEVALGA